MNETEKIRKKLEKMKTKMERDLKKIRDKLTPDEQVEFDKKIDVAYGNFYRNEYDTFHKTFQDAGLLNETKTEEKTIENKEKKP